MRRLAPGLAVAALGAAAGWAVHSLAPGVPWLTAALVLGVLAGCLAPLRPALDGPLRPGLALAARRLLRLGIVLLGLSLSLADIAALGGVGVLVLIALVGVAFAITWAIGRAFRLPGDEPVLLAAGFSVCGVSAIGAMSAARRSSAQDAVVPTALVTLFGTLAIFALPLLATPLALRGADYGRRVGASVHDVGQVVATAGVAGSAVLAVAVVVKLTRVLMLAPVVAIASLRTRRRGTPTDDESARPPVLPLFIVGFLALVAVRSILPIPVAVLDVVSLAQSALLAAALAGIGAGLRLERIARTGVRALAAGALSWALILALAYGTVLLAR